MDVKLLPLSSTRRQFLAGGSAALAAGGWSLPARAADAAPLKFMVLGDWGRNGAFHQQQVADAMGEFRQSQFVVTTGDNFYEHGVGTFRDRKWDTSFERIYTNVPQRWYSTLGNHDYAGRVEAQIERTFHDDRWRMPDRWFDIKLDAYGRPDVHLFVIDTVVWRGKEKFPFNLLGTPISRRDQVKQREWLQERLSGSDARIKIVFGHHPIYSVRTRGSYYGMPDLDALLFDQGVTAFVNGHDHCMYHISAPDWRGKATRRMHYICSGAGSKMRPVYPECAVQGLTQESCVVVGEMGGRQPLWHAFFTKSETSPSLDLKGGFAVFELLDTRLGVRFIEPVPDQANSRLWRERYTTHIPIPA